MNKKTKLVLGAGALVAMMVGGVAMAMSPNWKAPVQNFYGVTGNYEISFDKANHPVLDADYQDSVTATSRYTSFAFTQAKASSDGVAVLKGNGEGKIANLGEVTGIRRVSVETEGGAKLALYGSKDGKSLDHKLHTFTGSGAYEASLPYAYLVLVNEGAEAKVNAYTIQYTCVANLVDTIAVGGTMADTLVGANFNTEGAVLRVNYKDGTSADLVLDASLMKGVDTSSPGAKSAAINFFGATTELTYHVVKPAVATALKVGESKTATFDDFRHDPMIVYDNVQAPNSKVSTEAGTAIDGTGHLYVESSGAFNCVYLKQFVAMEVGTTYAISFDYLIHDFVDTLYFQVPGATNHFTQFGGPSLVGSVQHFSWMYTATEASDLFQIFPGGAQGKTSFSIDNFTVSHVLQETNEKPSSMSNAGDTMLETFGDPANEVFRLDAAPAPSSSVVSDGIEGSSVKIVSNGNYAGVFLVPFDKALVQAGTYTLEFDYLIEKFTDTMYLKFYWNGGLKDPEFPNLEVGVVHHFNMDFELAGQIDVLQFFPGGSVGETIAYLDNVRLTRK